MGKFTRAALEAMTIKQLKETASNESIDGIKSKMTKSDIVDTILGKPVKSAKAERPQRGEY
jgi:hypothetical protein